VCVGGVERFTAFIGLCGESDLQSIQCTWWENITCTVQTCTPPCLIVRLTSCSNYMNQELTQVHQSNPQGITNQQLIPAANKPQIHSGYRDHLRSSRAVQYLDCLPETSINHKPQKSQMLMHWVSVFIRAMSIIIIIIISSSSSIIIIIIIICPVCVCYCSYVLTAHNIKWPPSWTVFKLVLSMT